MTQKDYYNKSKAVHCHKRGQKLKRNYARKDKIRGWQTFFVKGQIINISGFVGHVASVITTPFCPCSAKGPRDNM